MKFRWVILLVLLSHLAWSQTKEVNNNIIKVLSFNILHGATTQGNFDLDVLAKVIKDANPDFVALQEVDFKTNRAKKYDLVTELGWRTKMSPLFARAMYFDGGEYGEGVLTKYSMVKSKNFALPYTQGNEPRAALQTIVALPTKDTIAFIGTHLDHLEDPKDRISQAKKLNEIGHKSVYPTILAGDLNDVPQSDAISILEQFWTSAYNKSKPKATYPSTQPNSKIDYVMYYPKNRWKVLKREVICDTIASDHCAYLVTLELLAK